MNRNSTFTKLETAMRNGRLAGKVCLITGSGGSIGLESALQFAREGAQIIGCDIDVDRSRAAAEHVRAMGGEMVSLEPCDLTDSKDCGQLVELAVSTFGRIDVLFNNAAMAYFGWLDELSVADFRRTLEEETTLVFQLTQAAWPHLIKSTAGAIVNVASLVAHQPQERVGAIAHGAAKAAVCAMTRQMAMEGAKHGLRANSISPGIILSNQTREFVADPENWASMGRKVMLNRPGEPRDIAACALYLASDESSFVTGADIRVDGGMSAW